MGHRRHPVADSDAGDLPAALHGPKLRKGLIRVLLFAAVVVALIVALPGLGSIRGRLSHGNPAWIGLAACFRFSSALAYVFLFRAIFTSNMSFRLSYQIGMSEIGLNALVPAGGAGGLATGGWVLHRRGMPTDEVVDRGARILRLHEHVRRRHLAPCSVTSRHRTRAQPRLRRPVGRTSPGRGLSRSRSRWCPG